MAMCVIAVVVEAPYQCFSPGGSQTTSPGQIGSKVTLAPATRAVRRLEQRVDPHGSRFS